MSVYELAPYTFLILAVAAFGAAWVLDWLVRFLRKQFRA